MRRRSLLAGGFAGLGTAYALERALAQRWRAGASEVAAAGLSMPDDVEHHFIATSDGGRIHAVEAGAGPPIVLMHGITLGVGIWVRQFRELSKSHRVIAVSLRGHGQSIGVAGGYTFVRLADDVLEVLTELDVSGAVVVGHSMGGMVLQVAALARAEQLRKHAVGIVLLATDAGPAIPGPVGRPVGSTLAVMAVRAAGYAERHSKGVSPGSDLATWGTRLCFGARPDPADVELVRSISAAVSPRAMAELVVPLFAFDVRIDLHEIDLPTLVISGSRDLLTPARRGREMAERILGARLEVLPGCGHIVMLERSAELNRMLEDFSTELTG
ncbi:MAG: alpha/beta fold hydrolase [Acidimicrobiales bacterium]